MEEYAIADLIEMFALPIGVVIWLVWMFIGGRGGNCMTHGRYRAKRCPECVEEQRLSNEQYDRNVARLRREGKLPR